MFNLVNEPWPKYNMQVSASLGNRHNQSWRSCDPRWQLPVLPGPICSCNLLECRPADSQGQHPTSPSTVHHTLCTYPPLPTRLQAVADRGLKPHEWTSARLHSTVLYLESHK